MTHSILIALALSFVGFIAAHAAILAQFIGADQQALSYLAMIQLVPAGAALLLLVRPVRTHSGFSRVRRTNLRDNLHRLWRRLPAWLIFAVVLLLVNVLLGEMAIQVARWHGNAISPIQHIPTLTITLVCVAFCTIYLLASAES